jgi:hypothetical protein
MTSRLVCLLFLLGMCGCAHEYHWAKPNVSQQEWTKDTYECERSAKERAYFERAFMGHLTVQNFFDQCLLARGYYKE